MSFHSIVARQFVAVDSAKFTAAMVREANDMLPIYLKVRRYLLLEKVTVLTQHVEGGPPRWRLTNPMDQHAIGVHTWRALNGAWVETLWHRRAEPSFAGYRVRMVDEEHRWKGFPEYVELYNIIGEIEHTKDNFDVEDVSAALLEGIHRAEKDAGIK